MKEPPSPTVLVHLNAAARACVKPCDRRRVRSADLVLRRHRGACERPRDRDASSHSRAQQGTRKPRSIDQSIDRSIDRLDRSTDRSLGRSCRRRLARAPAAHASCTPQRWTRSRQSPPGRASSSRRAWRLHLSVVKGSDPDVRHVILTVDTRLEQPVLRRHGGEEEVALLDQREPVVPRQAHTPHTVQTSSHHEEQP